jgi:hypothetical protein
MCTYSYTQRSYVNSNMSVISTPTLATVGRGRGEGEGRGKGDGGKWGKGEGGGGAPVKKKHSWMPRVSSTSFYGVHA